MNLPVRVESLQLNNLFNLLNQYGYTIIAPVIRDGSIIYDQINTIDELPQGWTDEQSAGKYKLKRRSDNAYFGYNTGPYSWKKFLFPPKVRLFTAAKKGKTFEAAPDFLHESTLRYAFIGVRPCELNAIKIQDTIFCNSQHTDAVYANLRKRIFIVAVNCTQAGGTCFCVSMNSGPRAYNGFDIALTEVIKEGEHFFLAEVNSEAGAKVINEISHRAAEQPEIETMNMLVQETAKGMGKSMDTSDIKEFIFANLENKHWDNVASRCLACANCTMVCPTCFCSTVEDVTDLSGEHAERWRRWDSCFTMDFAKVSGGNFRPSLKGRYRQWITHKLASWIDQFGTSGCVGCGRCITWCPVGIDITEEVKRLKNGY